MDLSSNLSLVSDTNLTPATQMAMPFNQASAASGNTYEDLMPFSSSRTLDDPMQDFNAFLESIGLSFDWDPEMMPSEHQHALQSGSLQLGMSNVEQGSVDQRLMSDEAPFSNFGSRLPSLQPESSPDDGKIATNRSCIA